MDPWLLFKADISLIKLSVAPPKKNKRALTLQFGTLTKLKKEENVTIFTEKNLLLH